MLGDCIVVSSGFSCSCCVLIKDKVVRLLTMSVSECVAPSTKMKERESSENKKTCRAKWKYHFLLGQRHLAGAPVARKMGLVKAIVAKEIGEKATGLAWGKRSRRGIAAMVRITNSGERATILT
jgi:hypothetical protein